MHKVVVFSFGKFKSRKCLISISRDYGRKGEKNKKALKIKAFRGYIFFIALVWLRGGDLNHLIALGSRIVATRRNRRLLLQLLALCRQPSKKR